MGVLSFIKWVINKIFLLLDFICSLLELHLVKIVSFTIMAMCCAMVNALHLIIVIMLLFFLLFGTHALRYSFTIIAMLLSLVFLSKMVYQTKFVPSMTKSVNCSGVNATLQIILEYTIFDPEWWGYHILNGNQSVISTYRSYILVFLVLTLQTVIRTRQKIARIDAGEPPAMPAVLFLDITRNNADRSFKNCLKFLINYGFYKFGVEITMSFCVFVIFYRVDVFSVIYALWLPIIFLPRRLTMSLFWPFFLTTVMFSILWQYAMAVGLSPKTCYRYPWLNEIPFTLWFCLPSFTHPPNTSKTLVDFALLILIQRQLAVFDLERKYGDKYLGGSNRTVYLNFYKRDFVNPTPDHTGTIRTWLDVVKFIFMSCLFRITLAFEFWNGASNANLLSLGYLVGSFVFFWIDYDIGLWHIKKILKWWNIMLGYMVLVILIKASLELAGCLYMDYVREHASALIELLSIRCSPLVSNDNRSSSSFYWDLHEVLDVIGVHKLQAKGAKFVDELEENKLKEFQIQERKTLKKIKKNVNRIKAWQKRMQGHKYNEPTDHSTALYSGDYYMFEDLDAVGSQVDESSSDESELNEAKLTKKSDLDKLTVTDFIEAVFKRVAEESTHKMTKKKEVPEIIIEDVDGKITKISKTSEATKNDIVKLEDEEEILSGMSDETKIPEEDSMKNFWKLLRSFLDSVMVTMIKFFNKNSRDFRHINLMMREERKMQKKKEIGMDGTDIIHKQSNVTPGAPKLTVSPTEGKKYSSKSYDSKIDELEDSNKMSSQALLVKLINSITMFIMSQTELFCYILIFLHTVLSPTLIALPLPLLVFWWGSLTTVRPTTTFWTVLIAYTEVTVVIKAVFQNSIFPWNAFDEKDTIRPEYPPYFLGIRRDNQYVVADLFLLLVLFLHRYKLKTLGLWNRTHEEETQPPQNLKIYYELPSEKNFKDVKGNRSMVPQKKKMAEGNSDQNDSNSYLQMAMWKCTSRATARINYWGNKVRTKFRVKEIEGPILVTHEGRRLQPTPAYLSSVPDETMEGNVVLRVYVNDFTLHRGLIYRLSWIQHFTSFRKFFVQTIVRDWRVSADFYTFMFIFEFLNFLVVFFGYSSFTLSDTTFTTEDFNLTENQVPPLYLFTMIAHFFVIIIDRILYLRKNIIGKLILQISLVTLVHVWMFILIPILTDSPFNYLSIPQTYYIISCLYFLMSAYQLRVGYPMRVQGHFLCKKYGYFNYYAFKGLQMIPFFNQVRTILDFICTHSSLTMGEWIRMESIFQLVFENKCARWVDINYPTPRGQECAKCSKYSPGISVLTGIIVVIWLPFILIALFNTVAQPNIPQEASLELYVGTFGKLYTTKATFMDVFPFTDFQFKQLQSIFKDNKKVYSFLSKYDYKDVGVLRFKFQPYTPWIATPQQLNLLNITITNPDISISMFLSWEILRIQRSQIVANAKGHTEIQLNSTIPARQQLINAFLGQNNKVRLNHVLPKFIEVTNEGKASPVSGFLTGDNHTNPYRNITLHLEQIGTQHWWSLEELADDGEENERISKIPHETNTSIIIYTFNEKNIPKLLLNISKKGIIGLYLSIVFFSWTFVRRLMLKYPYILYDLMPNPDPVLQLCYDIYLARESHEFALEEDLYAKLLFLFRSPETMIKVTRLNIVPQPIT